jgi:hypothetical protein
MKSAIVRVLINDSSLQLTRLLTILGSRPSRLRTPDNKGQLGNREQRVVVLVILK